ncbi:hypothetical protein NQ666_19010 [Acinetobacter baumannii]|uniref:hypothetical protein n=1 Tax=Acinetobacter calcoaceticus/baumannii complex TaxID=909768 RepID=UPI0002AE83D9|nr:MULTISPECIES: hypothetical protein [Acinetobacter calcoaceticus/baumannii complex]HAI54753.1 hypothetical protein [Acinetobacter nosocomialis]ELW79420.1 hypothetical protein ACIN5021_2837 [Acinetobacter sp. OIFC021]MDC4455992.1 hypothetical protein [Acinetobacter baumannii]MDH2626477.1 hypothetical protein [Acinetobacter baumannii]MDV7480482.1 hypothetical protein [Acinetobacter baumannii]
MFGYTETLKVMGTNGDKSLLENCRIDSNTVVFTKGKVEDLNIGDLLIKTYSNGYEQRFKIKGVSGPTPIPGVKRVEVVEV